MAKEFHIEKNSGLCRACEKEFAVGDDFFATVSETDAEDKQFERKDYCPECWAKHEQEKMQGLFGLWKSKVPHPQEKKKKFFVDDELIISFFDRLDGCDEPVRISFRFVLALVLMRKRILKYERMTVGDDGMEVWTMKFRGRDKPCEVIDPKMDEDKITEVSSQLGQILEGELG